MKELHSFLIRLAGVFFHVNCGGLAYIFIDLHHKILENYLRPNQRNQFEPKKQKK
jgi:hypothetical protein